MCMGVTGQDHPVPYTWASTSPLSWCLKALHGRIMNEDVTLTLGPRKAVLLCGSEQFQRRQG